MIDFACVSSTTPIWSNDPSWWTPGIAATEAEQGNLAADRASSAPVHGVHRYYPFVVEDRGRLGKSALTVVYVFAVLLVQLTGLTCKRSNPPTTHPVQRSAGVGPRNRPQTVAVQHHLWTTATEPTCSSNSNSKTSRRRRMLKLSMHSTLQPFKRSTAIMGLFLQARQCISPPAYPVPRRGTFSTTGTIQQASSSLNIIHKWHNLHKDIPGSTKVAV
eukprot:jgi/Tetstr1/455433/TSEL_042263.t1